MKHGMQRELRIVLEGFLCRQVEVGIETFLFPSLILEAQIICAFSPLCNVVVLASLSFVVAIHPVKHPFGLFNLYVLRIVASP